LSSARIRIDSLLATGCYRLSEVREFLPLKAGAGRCWAAVIERAGGAPEGTYHNVFIELKSAEEQEWARQLIPGRPAES
jgi:hypothetical protein